MKKQLQCVQIGTFTLFQAQVIEMFCVIFSNLKLAAILILLFLESRMIMQGHLIHSTVMSMDSYHTFFNISSFYCYTYTNIRRSSFEQKFNQQV